VDQLLEATWRAEQRHFWFLGFRRFVAPVLARAAGGRRDLRLLDCGCGTGTNLARLLDEYGRACGFDLTWRGLEFAHAQGRRRLAQASITHIPFRSATFDVVTSFDVLQTLTLEQAHAGLAEMWRVLKPGGAMVLNVAALEALRGNHSVLAEERHRYTKAMLRSFVEQAGFRVEHLAYTNTALFPLMLAVRSGQRMVGLKPAEEAEGEITVPWGPLNAALAGLLATEAAVSRIVPMPIGSSLVCLARKTGA
jgi:ubiquinone/menaquinone biosynthesis C-methylase UbiE